MLPQESHKARTKSVRLSPVDQIFTGPSSYPIEFVLQFDQHLDVDLLSRALRTTLPAFWPLCGRLRFSDANSYEVSWDGDFPELQTTDFSERSFPGQVHSRELLALSLPVESIEGKPLCAFHLYRFKEGSALVANISHSLADGYSFFYFLSQWARRCKGLTWRERLQTRLAPPVHDRSRLVPRDLDGPPLSFNDRECFARVGLSHLASKRMHNVKECRWQFIDFTQNEIDQARSGTSQMLSTNDVLSALLLKRLIPDGLFFDDRARIATAFDYRRVLPELSARYFGNAVRAAAFEIETSRLAAMNVVETAEKIRATTSSINLLNSRESLRYLERARLEEGLGFIQSLRVADEQRGLLITNLSRVPLAALDFGTGIPRQLIPLTPAPRSAVITAVPGGFRVRVSLPDETK